MESIHIKQTTQCLIQKFVQLDSRTWNKYLIDVKLACGVVLGVCRNQWRVLKAIQTAWKKFPRFYPMRIEQCRHASDVITNSVCDLRSTAALLTLTYVMKVKNLPILYVLEFILIIMIIFILYINYIKEHDVIDIE